MKKIIISVFLTALILIPSSIYIISRVPDQITDYFDKTSHLHRQFIETLPVYEDFATPAKEESLRKYLLNDHIKKTIEINGKPVTSDKEISDFIKNKVLVSVDPENSGWYFYNVPRSYRYLTPVTMKGLEVLSERFLENLRKRNEDLPSVKFALSSALRPGGYNREIQKNNSNVSLVSTHSYGTSFDIFYDEFYVVIPSAENYWIVKKNERFMGFLLGASLRRQFRAVLMESLLQLQEEGKLYAILEKRQRCYHVTILKQQ